MAGESMDIEPYGDALLADGFEDALLGFGFQFNAVVAIYDYEACIDILRERDGMSALGALAFFEFNVAGAYMGPNTPVFMTKVERIRQAVRGVHEHETRSHSMPKVGKRVYPSVKQAKAVAKQTGKTLTYTKRPSAYKG